jgi:hypothetical protein
MFTCLPEYDESNLHFSLLIKTHIKNALFAVSSSNPFLSGFRTRVWCGCNFSHACCMSHGCYCPWSDRLVLLTVAVTGVTRFVFGRRGWRFIICDWCHHDSLKDTPVAAYIVCRNLQPCVSPRSRSCSASVETHFVTCIDEKFRTTYWYF